ncbi:MAG TPA: ABC transporter permease [Desulfurococcales archaeon]|nr:ABC transporter permease [Desulfurococcales archaeon]
MPSRVNTSKYLLRITLAYRGPILATIGFAVLLYILSRVGLSPLGLIEAGLLAMTPLALAAIGESINQKAGLVNIGLEGIFLITALAGVYGAELALELAETPLWSPIVKALSPGVIGLLFGIFIGGVIGLIFGLLSVYCRADQIIVGIGINIFAYGFIQYLLFTIWAFPGIHIPPEEVTVPPLISTPEIRISGITLAAIAIAVVSHIILHRTPIGLVVKAAGESPVALDVAGVRVDRVRLATAILGGALTGLGGAFMSLAWFGGIVKEISAGRGFIALACVVSSGLEPLLSLVFAFIFGFAEGLSYSISVTPGVKEVVPYHLVHTIPYITTLTIVAIFIGKRRFPKAIATPYIKE